MFEISTNKAQKSAMTPYILASMTTCATEYSENRNTETFDKLIPNLLKGSGIFISYDDGFDYHLYSNIDSSTIKLKPFLQKKKSGNKYIVVTSSYKTYDKSIEFIETSSPDFVSGAVFTLKNAVTISSELINIANADKMHIFDRQTIIGLISTDNIDTEDYDVYVDLIYKKLDNLLKKDISPDDNIPPRPNVKSVENAKYVLSNFSRIICENHFDIKPYISNDGDGDITVGWYNLTNKKELHFVISEDEVHYITVWFEVGALKMGQGEFSSGKYIESEYLNNWVWFIQDE